MLTKIIILLFITNEFCDSTVKYKPGGTENIDFIQEKKQRQDDEGKVSVINLFHTEMKNRIIRIHNLKTEMKEYERLNTLSQTAGILSTLASWFGFSWLRIALCLGSFYDTQKHYNMASAKYEAEKTEHICSIKENVCEIISKHPYFQSKQNWVININEKGTCGQVIIDKFKNEIPSFSCTARDTDESTSSVVLNYFLGNKNEFKIHLITSNISDKKSNQIYAFVLIGSNNLKLRAFMEIVVNTKEPRNFFNWFNW